MSEILISDGNHVVYPAYQHSFRYPVNVNMTTNLKECELMQNPLLQFHTNVVS